MAALCAITFALASLGAAISVHRSAWDYLVVFAYIAVVSLLVYVQLPHDEQSLHQGEGEF